MSNTIRQFDYQIFRMKKGDVLPMNPIVVLCLAHWAGNNDESPRVSAHLMTDQEIDWQIQALKDDLDVLGKRAKAALRKAETETRAIVSERVAKQEGGREARP